MFIHVTCYVYEQREIKRITIKFPQILIFFTKTFIKLTQVILFRGLFNCSLHLQKLSKTCLKIGLLVWHSLLLSSYDAGTPQ